jgi:hypothetical protein
MIREKYVAAPDVMLLQNSFLAANLARHFTGGV